MRPIFVFILISFLFTPVFADTIVLKNGERIKGLILDEFKDRIVLSTAYGEKVFMKNNLKNAIYDSDTKALYRRAVNYERRGEYIKAYYAYEEVIESDPDMRFARYRMIYLENFLGKQFKKDLFNEFYRRKKCDEQSDEKVFSKRLFDEVGVSLDTTGQYPTIVKLNEEIINGATRKLTEKDRIISVWGEMTAYMDIREISSRLTLPGEVKFTIERDLCVDIPEKKGFGLNPFRSKLSKLVGADILLEKYGFVISSINKSGAFYHGGIREGDRICFVDGIDVNFMPYENIQDMILGSMGGTADISVRRNMSFWKKEPE
jgi:tetratricopeptide (TPR) repeat protein